MFTLLVIILVVWLVLKYVFNIEFIVGTGFSERKNQARDADYTVVENKDRDLIDKQQQ